VTGNRSLDEFADVEVEGEADEPENADVDADEASKESSVDSADETDVVTNGDDDAESSPDLVVTDEELAPPTSTYRFSPDGCACEACGETVQERWRDGDRFVCEGCKEW